MMSRQAVAVFKPNCYISSEKLGTWTKRIGTKRIGTKHIGPKHTGDKTYRRQNISATKRIKKVINKFVRQDVSGVRILVHVRVHVHFCVCTMFVFVSLSLSMSISMSMSLSVTVTLKRFDAPLLMVSL
jgi:hypothetical protein